jgi:hypothetical protein
MGRIRDMAANAAGYIDPQSLRELSDQGGVTRTGTYYVDGFAEVSATATGVYQIPATMAADLASVAVNLTGKKLNNPLPTISPGTVESDGYRIPSTSLTGQNGRFRPVTLTGTPTVG